MRAGREMARGQRSPDGRNGMKREAESVRDEKVSILNNAFFTILPDFTYRYIIKDALQLQVTEF